MMLQVVVNDDDLHCLFGLLHLLLVVVVRVVMAEALDEPMPCECEWVAAVYRHYRSPHCPCVESPIQDQ